MKLVRDILKKRKLPDELIQKILDKVNVDQLVKVEEGRLSLEIIDPPIIDDFDWRIHHQNVVVRYRFKQYFKNGGKLVVLKDGNIIIKEFTTNSRNPNKSKIVGFLSQKDKVVKERVANNLIKKYAKEYYKKPKKAKRH